MKLPQLTIRDLFWLLLVATLACVWWLERRGRFAAEATADSSRETILLLKGQLESDARSPNIVADGESLEGLLDRLAEQTQELRPTVASAVVPKFELTLKPQRAVFYAGFWVGGAGHPVGTSPKVAGGTLRMDDQQILLEHDTQQLLETQAGDRPNNHVEIVLVDADIHLESAAGEQSTNPPSSVSFYAVKIDNLHSVRWHQD